MRNDTSSFSKDFLPGAVRSTVAFVAVAGLMLCGSVSFADDEPAEAPTAAGPEGAAKYEGCTDPKGHPNQDPTVCKIEKDG